MPSESPYTRMLLCFIAGGLTWAAAALAEAPYSHDGEDMQDCGSCHVSAEPTKDNAALRACSRPIAGDREEWESSGNAPDFFILDQLSDIYVPVVFPHKLHASMTEMGMGCATCHHHAKDGKITGCGECHDPAGQSQDLRLPSLKGAYHRQCMGCHREWSHDNDCAVCHAKRVPGEEPKLPKDPSDITGMLHPNVEVPDTQVHEIEDVGMVTFHHRDHTQRFGISCAECHRQWDCNRCHEPDHVSGEDEVEWDYHQDCSLCHAQEVEQNCEFCHTEEQRPPFEHERNTGYALPEYHDKATCRGCHGDGKRFEAVEKDDCTSCHSGDWSPESFDHALVGVTMDEMHADMDCMACHSSGIGQPVDCTACHDDNRTSFVAMEEETDEVEEEEEEEEEKETVQEGGDVENGHGSPGEKEAMRRTERMRLAAGRALEALLP